MTTTIPAARDAKRAEFHLAMYIAAFAFALGGLVGWCARLAVAG